MKVYQKIAMTVSAIRNCQQSGNSEWLDKHIEILDEIERDLLPSGSGFDSGTRLVNYSKDKELVFHYGYHALDDNGSYEPWIHLRCYVTPSFLGVDVFTILCESDKNSYELWDFHKDYIKETFLESLEAEYVTKEDRKGNNPLK